MTPPEQSRPLSPATAVRRWGSAALPAVAAVAASAVALCGLSAWVASGAAGAPPKLRVTDARVLLPFAGNETTAVVFQIRNSGDADDRLTAVTSPVTGRAMLSRTSATRDGAARMEMVDTATVPARGRLAMSPYDLDVMVQLREPLRLGQEIPFVLHFEGSGEIETRAVVTSPFDWSSS